MANGIAYVAAASRRYAPQSCFLVCRAAVLVACLIACGCHVFSHNCHNSECSPDCPTAQHHGSLRGEPPGRILAALETLADDATLPLPADAIELTNHADGRIRAAVVRTLARRGHPEALRCARAALEDHDPQVVLSVVAALGELDTAESRQLLERLLAESPNPSLRAAAVVSLAKLNAQQSVLAAASDRAWPVRLEVARRLVNWPDQQAAAVAEQLLADPSPQVRRAVVQAVTAWPVERSGRILLAAMSSGSPALAKQAAELLAARWPPAAEYSVYGPAERRAAVLADLERRFREQYPVSAQLDRQQGFGLIVQRLDEHLLLQIEQMVARSDVESLRRCGPELVAALEHLRTVQGRRLPENVYIEVLPELAPEFALLAQMCSEELTVRRQAAQRLAALARQKLLRPLAVERLAEVVQAEADALVWCAALDAIDNAATPAAARLAYAGLSHPVPEVRRRACQYLAAHPSPAHAERLLPALHDSSHSVVVAAIRALGSSGGLDDSGVLRQLDAATNEQIRLEAAIAMVRLGDPAGPAALERLSYSEDPAVQLRVAQAMGEYPDPAYLEPLIRLLDGRPSVCRAALESLPKVTGSDVSQPLGTPTTTTQRVQRWKQWYQRRQAL